MVETEVARLRKLRTSALRVRAVARALSRTRVLNDESLLEHAACAAWRVSRAVSGRLRAHPYASFQRDAGLGVVVSNALVAVGAVMGATSRARALRTFKSQVQRMARELADARALTWTPDLSDSFGRSLSEFRPLLAQAEAEVRNGSRKRQVSPARVPAKAIGYTVIPHQDWPFIAL